MTAHTRIERIPHWPQMMLQKTAAAYCELSVAAFEREIASGVLPMPVILGGKPHWHREQIDQCLAALAGAGDWRASSNLYAA